MAAFKVALLVVAVAAVASANIQTSTWYSTEAATCSGEADVINWGQAACTAVGCTLNPSDGNSYDSYSTQTDCIDGEADFTSSTGYAVKTWYTAPYDQCLPGARDSLIAHKLDTCLDMGKSVGHYDIYTYDSVNERITGLSCSDSDCTQNCVQGMQEVTGACTDAGSIGVKWSYVPPVAPTTAPIPTDPAQYYSATLKWYYRSTSSCSGDADLVDLSWDLSDECETSTCSVQADGSFNYYTTSDVCVTEDFLLGYSSGYMVKTWYSPNTDCADDEKTAYQAHKLNQCLDFNTGYEYYIYNTTTESFWGKTCEDKNCSTGCTDFVEIEGDCTEYGFTATKFTYQAPTGSTPTPTHGAAPQTIVSATLAMLAGVVAACAGAF